MTDEHRDLDNLTKHPGWQLFQQNATKDVQARLDNALANAANNTNDTLAINLVRQVVAVKQQTEALLRWPDDRLRTLKAQAETTNTAPQLSRRGNL